MQSAPVECLLSTTTVLRGGGTSHKCRSSPEKESARMQYAHVCSFNKKPRRAEPERVLRFYSRCNSATYTFIVQLQMAAEVDVMHLLKIYYIHAYIQRALNITYIHTLYPSICILHNPLHDMILLERSLFQFRLFNVLHGYRMGCHKYVCMYVLFV